LPIIFGAILMKQEILALMKKEQTQKISFLSKDRISELIQKLEDSSLSSEDKREIADHILANYLDEVDGGQVEDSIDWILKDVG
jgi:uncharacterized membrane protein